MVYPIYSWVDAIKTQTLTKVIMAKPAPQFLESKHCMNISYDPVDIFLLR